MTLRWPPPPPPRDNQPPLHERPYALSLMRAVRLGLNRGAMAGHTVRAKRIALGLPPDKPRADLTEYKRAYYAAHREEARKRAREWYAKNRERSLETQRRYRAARKAGA